ncbi:hypothetical protein BKA56DRAFT_586950 [Ilyonectria sp. MPI-CAGE-AT-0026]|nr:hypothetical protein BKA56DRAFT_586950 [Ilyonectria sp. MPI-CAGE-AT-0026]
MIYIPVIQVLFSIRFIIILCAAGSSVRGLVIIGVFRCSGNQASDPKLFPGPAHLEEIGNN